MKFLDRHHAGHLLGEKLKLRSFENPIVLALPRGGVPVGYEIARQLHCPLDILVVRKVGAPTNPEFGIGAITEDGCYWIDENSRKDVGASPEEVEDTLGMESLEVERRVQLYRQGRGLPSLQGRSVIVVDDGLATGVTARVACAYVKRQGGKVTLAVPVCSPAVIARVKLQADDFIALTKPHLFLAVGQFYENFDQVTDDEVIRLLSGKGGYYAHANSRSEPKSRI